MNILPSLVRTYVPILVGFLVSLLASIGIVVDDEQRGLLVTGIGAVASALYYLLARLLEQKFPALTWLLGSSVQPVEYQPAVVDTDVPGKHEAPGGNDSVAAGTPPPTV